MNTKDVQKALAQAGFDPGPIDGVTGRRTVAAIMAFQKERGLVVDGIVGPKTRQVLFPTIARDRLGPAAGTVPPWLRNAIVEIGQKETVGRGSNTRILAYRALGKTSSDKTTEDGSRPWCADFVNAMIETAGLKGTASGAARSFERSKHFTKLTGPALGAILVFWRTSRASGKGHTAFYVGHLSDKRIAVLGGNQRDEVNVSDYSTDRLIGYFWPKDHPLPTTGSVPAIIKPGQTAGSEV